MNLSQNLSSKVFSAQSSRPIINLINMTKTNHCEKKNRVEKYFNRLLRSLVEYVLTLQEKFRISVRPCNILYFFLAFFLHAMGRVLIKQ